MRPLADLAIYWKIDDIMLKQSLQRLILNLLKRISHYLYPYSAHLSPNSGNVLRSLLVGDNTQKVLIDCGAHHGESVHSLSRLFPGSVIYSLEPNPSAYAILHKLDTERVKTFNIGLSSNVGGEYFSINKNSLTSSLLPLDQRSKITWPGLQGLEEKEKLFVQMTTLDAFVFEQRISSIDLLKIDVQGAEFKVLQGAKETLRNKKVKIIQLELILGRTYRGQKTPSYYFSILEEAGYRLAMISDLNIRNGRLVQCDAFFEPNRE